MSNQQHLNRIKTISSHISNNISNNGNKSDQQQSKISTNLNEQYIYDVCVVGGGLNGSSIAYTLQKQGHKVLLLDQFDIAHDKGSSHGDGRIIRFSYPEDIYIEMAKLAYPAWDAIESESGEKLIQITGGIDFGGFKEKPLLDLLETYKKFKIPHQVLDWKEANYRFPQFQFNKDNLIIYQPDAGVIYASKAVKVIWGLAKRFGATTLSNKKVDRIKIESENLATILTEDQSIYKCKKVVLACGGWINEILLRSQLNLQLPVEITQEKVFYWEPKDTTPKEIDYSQYSNPISISYGTEEEGTFYSLPQIDIRGVKIGYHHSGTVLNNMVEKGTKPYPTDHYQKIQKFVQRYNPGLNCDRDSHSLTCVYTNTSDLNFIIDKHPKYSNLVLASACSGHGAKFAPATGQIVSELLFKKNSSLTSLNEFSLDRFKNPIIKRTSA